jgi:hypothetical protein
VDYLLFHEGNISAFDQRILGRLSGIPIRFVSVSEIFKPKPQDEWTGTSDFGLGYSLMCRFNYEQVWDFLAEYEIAYRVDEDVIILSLPLPTTEIESDMAVGCLSEESHALTNATLPEKLKVLGVDHFYDHRFPYTNCYVTRVDFWLKPEVKEFVQRIGDDPRAIENRWGDLPVIGVALRSFGAWDPESSVDPKIRYAHGSHRASVLDGRLVAPDSPLRHRELGWIAWVLVSIDAVGNRAMVAKKAIRRLRSGANESA